MLRNFVHHGSVFKNAFIRPAISLALRGVGVDIDSRGKTTAFNCVQSSQDLFLTNSSDKPCGKNNWLFSQYMLHGVELPPGEY